MRRCGNIGRFIRFYIYVYLLLQTYRSFMRLTRNFVFLSSGLSTVMFFATSYGGVYFPNLYHLLYLWVALVRGFHVSGQRVGRGVHSFIRHITNFVGYGLVSMCRCSEFGRFVWIFIYGDREDDFLLWGTIRHLAG